MVVGAGVVVAGGVVAAGGATGVVVLGATGVVVDGSGAGIVAGTVGVGGKIGASLENISVITSQAPSRLTHVTTDLPLSLTEEPAASLL